MDELRLEDHCHWLIVKLMRLANLVTASHRLVLMNGPYGVVVCFQLKRGSEAQRIHSPSPGDPLPDGLFVV